MSFDEDTWGDLSLQAGHDQAISVTTAVSSAAIGFVKTGTNEYYERMDTNQLTTAPRTV